MSRPTTDQVALVMSPVMVAGLPDAVGVWFVQVSKARSLRRPAEDDRMTETGTGPQPDGTRR